MGMYTEFYFRANVKDGPVADWLDRNINSESAEWFDKPFDSDAALFKSHRWALVFIGGCAAYQEARMPVFRRRNPNGGEPRENELVLAVSLKNYGQEIEKFVDWITPHLDMYYGDFLGFSLYEDSKDEDDIDRPKLFFHKGDR